jgi:hypothetical protein
MFPVKVNTGAGVGEGVGVALGLGLREEVEVAAPLAEAVAEPPEQPTTARARSRPARPKVVVDENRPRPMWTLPPARAAMLWAVRERKSICCVPFVTILELLKAF